VEFHALPDDDTDKWIIVDGIKVPLFLPFGVYFRHIKTISYHMCNSAICLEFTLVKILELFNEQLENEYWKLCAYRNIENDKIDFSRFGKK
jgi:hypothetical protein